MSVKLVKIRKIVLPLLALGLLISQLTGCAAPITSETPEIEDKYENKADIDATQPGDGGQNNADDANTAPSTDDTAPSTDSIGPADGGASDISENSSDPTPDESENAPDNNTPDAADGITDNHVETNEDVTPEPEPNNNTVEEENFKPLDELVYAAGDSLRVYSEYGDDGAEVVGTLNKGDMLLKIGEGKDGASGWSQVILNGGIIGYIRSDDLSLTDPLIPVEAPSNPPENISSSSVESKQPANNEDESDSQSGFIQDTSKQPDKVRNSNDVIIAKYEAGTKVWVLTDFHVNAEPDSFSEDVGVVKAGESYTLLSGLIKGVSIKDGKIANTGWWCYKIQLADGTIGYIHKYAVVDFDPSNITFITVDNTEHNIAYYESFGYTVSFVNGRYVCTKINDTIVEVSTMRYSYFYTSSSGEIFCGSEYYPPYNTNEGFKIILDNAIYIEENRHTDYSAGYEQMKEAYDRLTGSDNNGG